VKKISFLFLLFHGFFPSVAQTFFVSDSSGRALEGATLLIRDAEGNKFFAVTGKDGKAESGNRISFPASVEISMLGYHPKKVLLNEDAKLMAVSLDSKSYRLEEVIVTGQAAPVTVNETMQDAVVISKEKIQLMAASRLESIMQYESASAISRDPVLGSNLSLRGLSGNNIKYLVNGVPVTGRMNGFVDLSQLNIDNARQIEIINGPMAVNYGSDAHGGVINIITNGKKENKVNISGMAETAGRVYTHVMADYASGKSAFGLNAGREFFEGWNDGPEIRWKQWKPKTQYTAAVNASHRFSYLTLSASADFMNEKLSNKGEPVITPYYAYALDEYYFTRRWINQIAADYMIHHDSRIKTTLAYSVFNRIKNRYRKDLVALEQTLTDGAEQDTSNFNSLHFRTDYSFTSSDKKTSFLTGTEFNHETAEGKRTGGKQTDYQAAVYATAEWKAMEKLRMMPGLRLNYFSNETFRVVPAMSLRYDVTEKLFMRCNYSMGFRQPSLKERFLEFQDVNHNIRGNENLMAETSHNFTFSFNTEKQSGKILLTAGPVIYFTSIRDMITLAQVNQQDNLYSYINLGKYQTQGVSFSISARTRMLNMNAGFSVNGVKDELNDHTGYSPGANGSVLFTNEKAGLKAGMFIRWSGSSYIYTTGDAGIASLKQGAFTLAETSISKAFFKNKIMLQSGIKNLFDVKRIETSGTGDIHSGNNLPAGTGRSYFVKLTLSTGK
jgi:outer membrane receptor for ferrienterochelin and colicins